MAKDAKGLKWKLNDSGDLQVKDHNEATKDVGIEGIVLLTMGLMAFAVVIFGSIIFCLIKFAAEKIITWNILRIIKTFLDKAKKLDEEFFYGKDMTK